MFAIFLHKSSIVDIGDVQFSLNGTKYRNNSLVTLEDIDEDDNALLCITNSIACCGQDYKDENGSIIGNWFFANRSKVPRNPNCSGLCDFYMDAHHMMVCLNHRRSGVEGIYMCEIPDSMNITQTIYIGVYTAGIGVPAVHVPSLHKSSITKPRKTSNKCCRVCQ